MAAYLEKAILTPEIVTFCFLGTYLYQNYALKLQKELDLSNARMLYIARLASLVTAGLCLSSLVTKNPIWFLSSGISTSIACLGTRQIYVRTSQHEINEEVANLFLSLSWVVLSAANFYLGFALCVIFLGNSTSPNIASIKP
jgi:hypothetical protein